MVETLLPVEGVHHRDGPVKGIGDDGDEIDVLAVGTETGVGLAELLGDDRTVARADRVEERECDHVPPERESETDRPDWSTRSKPGAGMSTTFGVPSRQLGDDRVGVRIDRGERHGHRADEHDADCTDRGETPDEIPSGESRPPRRSPAVRCHRSSHRGHGHHGHHGHGHGDPRDRQVAGHEKEDGRQHAVRVGAGATEDPEVLHEDPVRKADDRTCDDRGPDQAHTSRAEKSSDPREHDDDDEVHGPPVGQVEALERRHSRCKWVRLRSGRHLAEHLCERPGP